MINVIVQNGLMRNLASNRLLRRLIVAVVAFMVVAISIDMHPGSLHTAPEKVTEASHIHDVDDDESGQDLSHKSIHHDHHAESLVQTGIDLSGIAVPHDPLVDQTNTRQVRIALDRPPSTAQC